MYANRIIMKRIVAFLIDWVLIFLVGSLLLLSTVQFNINYLIYPSAEMFSPLSPLVGLLCFVIFPIARDCFPWRASIGKWIMGLKIVKLQTLQKPDIKSALIRNILFYLFFVELIALLNNGRSVGDNISHTIVVERSNTWKSK